MQTRFRLILAASLLALLLLVHWQFEELRGAWATIRRPATTVVGEHREGNDTGTVASVDDQPSGRPGKPSSSAVEKPVVELEPVPADSAPKKPLSTIPAPAETVQTEPVGNESSFEGSAFGDPVPEKVIVMAKLQRENTSWVAEKLSDWSHAIYTVDNQSAPLHTPVNKGAESMAYLTYIIDNYHRLPTLIVFIHSHEDGYPKAWHTDNDEYDNVKSLRSLNQDFVQRNGFTNLRCIWTPGCPDEIQPFRESYKVHDDAEHRIAEQVMAETWKSMFNNTNVPRQIGTACCAQFAVSRKQVLARPREDYERIRRWVLETEVQVSGRVLEYLWHIIFGREAVHCPELEQCYCDVYRKCP